jgi:acid phosphatase type 7
MTRRTILRPRSRLARRAAVLLAATATFSVSLLSAGALLPRSAAAALTTVVASADSKVQADTPDTNYGTTTSLAARGPAATSPQQRSYIKVTVSGLSGPPASARLDLYSYAVSATGIQVSTAGNDWTETGITWNTAPAVGSLVATVGPLTSNTTASADVSSVVTGNGTYTFAITTTSTTGKTYASREAAGHPPTLVLDTSAPPLAASAPGTTSGTTSGTATTTASGTTAAATTGTATTGTATTGTATTGTATTGTATTGTATTPATGSATGTLAAAAAATTATFAPSADGYVESDTPTTAYGTGYQLNAQAPSASGTPEERAYLTFTVKGLTGTVTSAKLTLYTYSTWANGVTVSSAGSGWTESSLTWATAPAVGAAAGTAKNLVNGNPVSVDVTPAVAGNGTVGLVITTDRTTGLVKFASREASANKPQLVVQTTTGTTTGTSSTSPTTPSPAGTSDPTIVAAGDIACPAGKTATATSCQQMATSDLAISLNPTAVLPLGDDQYELGNLSDFQTIYGPSWGRLNPIAHPVPGNHEYGYIGTAIQPTGGQGYFTYFGDRGHPLSPGCTNLCTSWYSWNIGSWHMVALDSQCGVVGGCNPGSPQYQWLLNDLNSSTAKCTLAYWHIPIYSSSTDHQPDMQAIYKLLYDKKADVVLNGHAHFYERFAGQDAAGNADPANGIPEFIVGSGGRSFFAMRATPSANSVSQIANTFGILRMTLSNGGYSWRFVPSNAGGLTDSGSATCH